MYVKNRLVSDVIEITKIKNVSYNGYWKTMWFIKS